MLSQISNFQSPKDYEELLDDWYNEERTNLDIALEDSREGITEWSVDANASIGDTVYLMCAKTSKDHMGHVVAQARQYNDPHILAFALRERELFKKYAGKIIAVCTITGEPYDDPGLSKRLKFAEMSIMLLEQPISIDEFRDFITISRTGTITKLDENQTNKLNEIIADKNEEYQKEYIKHVTGKELERLAISHSERTVTQTIVTTKQYNRDSWIAKYTKERANGICQLCGKPAPFKDANGDPYLESHHIIPLSEGGEDSLYNTIALCPNCHRKMHVVKDRNDIKYLLQKNKDI